MPTIIIMAGGMGSRYGGLKQLESFGKNGEKIIDFTVFDALRAGFNHAVFVIKEENYGLFKEVVGNKISKHIKTDYVFQSVNDLPEGFSPVTGREKPLGTGHAVWCCRNAVNEPFAVVNADDYYGSKAFELLADFFKNVSFSKTPSQYCMAGFKLANTLTENGTVSRGVCKTSGNGLLSEIKEHTKIEAGSQFAVSRFENGQYENLPLDSVVSMNCWGFLPDFFNYLEDDFKCFLKGLKNELKDEFYLPFAVDNAMKKRLCDVTVLRSPDKWHGVTYKEDAQNVRKALCELSDSGLYPNPLFR